MLLSIIILLGGRKTYAEKCLESIVKSIGAYGNKGVEIIFICNNLKSGFKNYIDNINDKIKVGYFEVNIREKSLMRNFGIEKATGDVLYFLDSDVIVGDNFIEKIFKKFNEYPEVSIIGGPNFNPPDSTVFERAQGYVLSTFWGAAGMSRRYRNSLKDLPADQTMLILCNLGFRKKIFMDEKILFDSRLKYNEENDLLKKFEKKRYKMLFTPEIPVFHYRRSGAGQYVWQVVNSGIGRAKSIKIYKPNFNIIYFLPLIFVLYIISLPFLFSYNAMISIVAAIVYVIATLLVSIYIFLFYESNIIIFIYTLLLSFAGHFSYGIGMIAGFLLPLKKMKQS